MFKYFLIFLYKNSFLYCFRPLKVVKFNFFQNIRVNFFWTKSEKFIFGIQKRKLIQLSTKSHVSEWYDILSCSIVHFRLDSMKKNFIWIFYFGSWVLESDLITLSKKKRNVVFATLIFVGQSLNCDLNLCFSNKGDFSVGS